MTNRPMTTATFSHLIETWWDATSRNWVTQIKDTEGNQIGSALFAGNKASAKVNHLDALAIAAGLEA
jgi:hypothetical protein